MFKVSVMYPDRESAKFDFEYYIGTHMKLVDAGKGHGLLDRLSHAAFVKVMPSYLPGTWVLAQRFGWKNILPSPLTTGIEILPGKCTG